MNQKTRAINTDVMKLVKDDDELATECRGIVEALVGKMAEMLTRGLVVNIGVDNGEQSGKPALTMFKVHKRIAEFQAPQQGQPQGR